MRLQLAFFFNNKTSQVKSFPILFFIDGRTFLEFFYVNFTSEKLCSAQCNILVGYMKKGKVLKSDR